MRKGLTALFALIVAWSLSPLAMAGDRALACYEDWSEAAAVVAREGLVPVEQLIRLAARAGTPEIVKAELCREDGRAVYRLVIRAPDGRLRKTIVDAKAPFSAP